MDKEKYLVDLENVIKQIPEKKRKVIIAKYNRLITRSGLSTEAEIEHFLGTAQQVGYQILADAALRERKRQKRNGIEMHEIATNWHVFMMMLMAISSSPMTYLLGTFAIWGYLLIGILAFLVGFIIVIGMSATIALGGILVYAGIGTLLSAFAVGVFHLGIGLIFISIVLLLVPLIHKTYILIFALLNNLGSCLYLKFKQCWHNHLSENGENG
ncbi:HAAS domain-containing protein [Ligilactobacillus cholophilus]|uniref:HAAS domain-containing protein n=1 Tax=Ligilactobacillus cholophilus TaxID=3050131 RepID=UPI0025B22387|nr:DUF1700 domain-containing protein [Ligilactobacillus cholophilus]